MSNDPKGKAATGKLKFENIPLTALVDLANGMNDGAAKYGSHNWLTVEEPIDNMVYINAALRHLVLYMAGEDAARDSGVNHLAHVICGLSVLRSAEAVGKVQDNRRKLPGEAINRLAEDVCGPAYVASNQLDRACADNPELPREFVKDILSKDLDQAGEFMCCYGQSVFEYTPTKDAQLSSEMVKELRAKFIDKEVSPKGLTYMNTVITPEILDAAYRQYPTLELFSALTKYIKDQRLKDAPVKPLNSLDALFEDQWNDNPKRVFKSKALLESENFIDSGLGGPETRLSDTQFNINAHYSDKINYGGTD